MWGEKIIILMPQSIPGKRNMEGESDFSPPVVSFSTVALAEMEKDSTRPHLREHKCMLETLSFNSKHHKRNVSVD